MPAMKTSLAALNEPSVSELPHPSEAARIFDVHKVG